MAGRDLGTTRRRAAIACLALLGSAAVAIPAFAADQYENNDTQATATRMQPGKTYEADIDKLDDAITQTKGDVDWYSLNAAAGKVEVAYKALQNQGSCFAGEARLMDAAGKTLGTAQPAKGDTETIKYTATADGLLYLRVQQYQIDSCNAPIPYELTSDFTPASGGGNDGSIDGLKIKAKKKQKQKGNGIVVLVKVGAAEQLEAAAKGSVKLGKKKVKVKLKQVATTIGAGKTAKLPLAAGGKAAKRIHNALDAGDKVKAKVEVAVADSEGNADARGLTITLR